jgi:hypothetical protein
VQDTNARQFPSVHISSERRNGSRFYPSTLV